MNSTQVLDVLNTCYSGDGWVFLRELRMGTGKIGRRRRQPRLIKQRIDAWAFNTWPSVRNAISFEVKISRTDFLAELRKPKKREAARSVSNYFYFVTIPGVVLEEAEIPEGCGWIEVVGDLVTFRRYASRMDFEQVPMHFFSSIVRRAGRVSAAG